MIKAVGDHDRDAILARRALFVSAALAGLACASQRSSSGVEVESKGSGAAASARPFAGVRPPWSEVMATAPALDVPEGLGERERELLSALASDVGKHYDELARVWPDAPACWPSDDDCGEDWAALVSVINEVNTWYGFACSPAPWVTHTYRARWSASIQHLRELSDLLVADLDAAINARAKPEPDERRELEPRERDSLTRPRSASRAASSMPRPTRRWSGPARRA